MKSNNGILDIKELEQRARFWDKKTFRTITNRELERDSREMQKLLVAMASFTKEEIQEIRNRECQPLRKTEQFTIWFASEKDYRYALSILPKVKQG